MNADQWAKSAETKPEWTITRLLLTVVAILAIVGAAIWAINLITAPAVQAGKIVEKTIDADNVIHNYEYFKQAYQDVQAADKKIAIAEAALAQFVKDAGSRDKWDFRDKEEHQRLTTNVTGVKSHRADLVATYNARAKMANRSIFMGKDVPQQIE
jgi:hypothetical protein